jgi:hypothetical protein
MKNLKSGVTNPMNEITMSDIAAWLSRIGILFEFVAFLFAAPEIVKDERLDKFIEKLLLPFFMAAMLIPFIAVGYTYSLLGKPGISLSFIVFSLISILAIFLTTFFLPLYQNRKAVDDAVRGYPPRRKYLIYGAALLTLALFLQFGASFWL